MFLVADLLKEVKFYFKKNKQKKHVEIFVKHFEGLNNNL